MQEARSANEAEGLAEVWMLTCSIDAVSGMGFQVKVLATYNPGLLSKPKYLAGLRRKNSIGSDEPYSLNWVVLLGVDMLCSELTIQ